MTGEAAISPWQPWHSAWLRIGLTLRRTSWPLPSLMRRVEPGRLERSALQVSHPSSASVSLAPSAGSADANSNFVLWVDDEHAGDAGLVAELGHDLAQPRQVPFQHGVLQCHLQQAVDLLRGKAAFGGETFAIAADENHEERQRSEQQPKAQAGHQFTGEAGCKSRLACAGCRIQDLTSPLRCQRGNSERIA